MYIIMNTINGLLDHENLLDTKIMLLRCIGKKILPLKYIVSHIGGHLEFSQRYIIMNSTNGLLDHENLSLDTKIMNVQCI